MGKRVINQVCRITRTVQINDAYFELWFSSPEMSELLEPGQFFEIMTPGSERLRIPISAYDKHADEIGMMIKIVGDGTRQLSTLKPGDALDVVGPLGNSFTRPTDKRVLLVSGGIGYPPMFMLKKSLDESNRIWWVHGGRCKQDAFDTDCVFTDDGSCGSKGFATIGVEKALSEGGFDWLFACGPEPLLKRCAELAKAYRVQCELSLEAYMACGIGVCYGCAVAIKENDEIVYKTVCKDGPVFNGENVVWK